MNFWISKYLQRPPGGRKKNYGTSRKSTLDFQNVTFSCWSLFPNQSLLGARQNATRWTLQERCSYFFPVLLDHSDTIQPKNPMWHAWGKNITTMKLAPDFSSERARKDWEVHCPHDTPYQYHWFSFKKIPISVLGCTENSDSRKNWHGIELYQKKSFPQIESQYYQEK